ncbi:transposase [Acrocarpospora corrugata]|uniref:Transposase n=1 Tax=Acrocarpospora corrugata TaxID=35763 RepID=A0A5M3W4C1_9ACTN|nr:DDE-type integrase/transposase/recombinase [Acrocarpospora corrugata]GES02011.1 transposase [Acrocarpospora corrugata]
MTKADEEARRRAERARRMALFRYEVIQDLIDPALSTRQRGVRARALAQATHTDPFGNTMRISRNTLDRWVRWWREGGFEALVPVPAKVPLRTDAHVLELAAALKREKPERTAAQVRRIMIAAQGWAPSTRTLQRLFEREELGGLPAAETEAFGRFEATRPNELWTGDALHGPLLGGRKTYLFAFIDDHSRAVMAARFGFSEDVVRLAAALRPALAARGVPDSVYVDNGSAFVDSWLLRGCASLGIKLVHSTPGRPQGRGKIERFFRTVREQFLVEFGGDATTAADDLAGLNRLLVAWIETDYHVRVHSQTGAAPLKRWQHGITEPLPRPTPAQLREAFKWSQLRVVAKTATVSLHGNTYQVDAALVGRQVELVFDPFDLNLVEVRYEGRSFGAALPFTIKRHSHPKARPETLGEHTEPAPTGIDYLALMGAAHDERLAEKINYSALFEPGPPPRTGDTDPGPTPTAHHSDASNDTGGEQDSDRQ